MLTSRDACRDLLRCPKTGVTLEPFGTDALCTADRGLCYPLVNGVPVLVDFDNSVLEQDNVLSGASGSPLKRVRHRGVGKALKRLVSPAKKATKRNVGLFLKSLKASNPHPLVLIIGGGTVGQGMNPFYEDQYVRVLSFDIYYSLNIQFIADAHKIPLADESVDGVVIQAVLEHVLQPAEVVAEIWRVLKPEGLVYAETPFMQQVHEGAYDFTRFTESGHRYLFRKFALVRSGVSAGVATQFLWSIDYFGRSLFRSRAAGKLLKLLFFWVRWFDNVIPESYAIDGASGVYFMGRKALEETTPHEIIRHYRGAQASG